MEKLTKDELQMLIIIQQHKIYLTTALSNYSIIESLNDRNYINLGSDHIYYVTTKGKEALNRHNL